MNPNPFHLAVKVNNLEEAEDFYTRVIGCSTGRRSSHWIDFNFFGHQLVCHLDPDSQGDTIYNPVDSNQVPVPHFGCILSKAEFEELASRLKAHKVTFIIEPTIRFAGQTGEQGTFFLMDPSNNALEFKYFSDPEQIFAAD